MSAAVWWCCLVLVLAAGCVPVPDFSNKLDSYFKDMVSRLDEQIAAGGKNGQPGEVINLDFRDACRRAALNDQTILKKLAELRSREIDVDQARSYIWPRVDFRAKAEAPLDNGRNDSDFRLTGGIFLWFDLWKAMFSSAEVQARQAAARTVIEELKLALEAVSSKVYLKLAAIEACRREVAIREEILADVRKGLRIVEAYGQMGRVNMSAVWTWEAKVNDQAARLQEAQARLASEQSDLVRLLGTETGGEIGVTDAAPVLEEGRRPSEEELTASRIWARRGEARLAEMELFAAEVGITLAGRERLPKLSASLGLGNIELSSQNDEASSALMLELTMPLVDFGDSSRQVAKARVNRDHVQRQVEKLALRLWREADEAKAGLSRARENLRMTEETVDRLKGRDVFNRKLLEQNGLDPLEVLGFQMEMKEAEIAGIRAGLAVHQAATAYRQGRGDPVRPGLIGELLDELLKGAPGR